MKIERTVSISLEDIAAAFAHASSEDQVRFFNVVVLIAEQDYAGPKEHQWAHIAMSARPVSGDPTDLTGMTDEARRMVTDWAEYFGAEAGS